MSLGVLELGGELVLGMLVLEVLLVGLGIRHHGLAGDIVFLLSTSQNFRCFNPHESLAKLASVF